MNPDQLEKFRIARPFLPFTIHTSDGVDYPIPLAEYIIRTRSGRSIAVLSEDGETFAIIEMLHVTRLTSEHMTDLAPEEPRRKQA